MKGGLKLLEDRWTSGTMQESAAIWFVSIHENASVGFLSVDSPNGKQIVLMLPSLFFHRGMMRVGGERAYGSQDDGAQGAHRAVQDPAGDAERLRAHV